MNLRKTSLIGGVVALAAISIGAGEFALAAEQTVETPNAEATTNLDDASSVEPSTAAVTFVEALIADATVALTNEAADQPQRISDFQKVLGDGLALKTLAKFMLGRRVYDGLTEEQQERYDAVFPDYITKQYAEQFDGILGRPLEVTETTPFRKDIFVRTRFVDNDSSPINVDWRTRALKSGGHKLIDIVVNGASIMSVKKSEFEGFIKQNGVDALLDRLEAETVAA